MRIEIQLNSKASMPYPGLDTNLNIRFAHIHSGPRPSCFNDK